MYAESSSSDSSGDNGDRNKNVSKLIVKSSEGQRALDEHYAYKQKLGDLIFDANFEGGNLGAVKQINQFEYDLMVRPDAANPRHRVWFNFRVCNQRPDQCVVFNLINLSENLSLISDAGLTPVVRSRRQPNWVRMRLNQVFYYRSSSHNNRRVLSIAFRFAMHDNEHQFALFYPYTLSTLEHFLSRWNVQLRRDRDDERPQLKLQVLARSTLNKPIYELSILASGEGRLRQRPWAIVLGRMGANCESASSFVCQGLMDFMLSADRIAASARKHLNLLIFPMLDPDSIWAGNSRADLVGQQPADDQPVVDANPSLYKNYRLVRKRVEDVCANARQQRTTIIEMRVNASLIGSRMVGSHYADATRMERHLRFPRLLSRFSDGFYLERCEFLDTPQPSNASCDSYRLEVSPLGCHERSLVKDSFQEFDQSRYLLLGKSLAFALLELYRPRSARPPGRLSLFLPTARDVDDLVLNDMD